MIKRIAFGMLCFLLIGLFVSPFNVTIALEYENTNTKLEGPTETSIPQAVDWWPMFAHDLQNTGYSPSGAPKTNQTLWVYRTDGDIISGPAVVDGVVFIGSGDNRIYALNATTGGQIWNYTTGGWVHVTPAVIDGLVFVSSSDGKVYCLNKTTGEKTWDCPIVYNTMSSPAVADGVVFIGGGEFDTGARVYAINMTTGELIWEYKSDPNTNPQVTNPAVAEGKVFIGISIFPSVGNYALCLFALNETTGEPIWNFTISTIWGGHVSPAVSDGVVFVGGGYPHRIYALNQTDGSEIWSSELEGTSLGSPAVAYGMVFAGDGEKFYAFNKTTGELVWANEQVRSVDWCTPAVADKAVFVNGGQRLYAISAKTGALLWSYYVRGQGNDYANPAIADGMVFACPGNRYIYPPGTYFGEICAFYSPPVHDVSVVGVKSSPTIAEPEDPIHINVTVENQGDYAETFNVTARYNDSVIGEQEITLGSMDSTTLIFTWNTTEVPAGDYIISASASTVPDEIDTSDNTYIGDLVNIFLPNIAITNVAVSKTVVIQGYSLNANVTIENEGIYTETFNLTAYANTTIIDKKETVLTSGSSTTISITWNTTEWLIGHYTVSANATILPNEADTADNSYIDGIVTVRLPIYDIAVTNVTPSKTVVCQDYMMYINVTVENHGDFTETFNVTVYANETIIQTKNMSLTSGNSMTSIFTWNATGFAKGNYTIRAYSWPVLGETNTADNNFTDGWVIVSMIGDITGPDLWPDGLCNMRDVGLVARYFGQNVPPAPPNCDITGPITGVPDGTINMRDVGLVARHFGETDP